MDLSEQYIEMCRKATEIQGLWKPSVGDFTKDVKPVNVYILGYDDLNNIAGLIWLPRQDQLQEIWLKYNERKQFNETDFDILMQKYFLLTEYAEDSEYLRAGWVDSLEKLWLLIVMKEKFNKLWDGSDWTTRPSEP